VVLDNEWVDEPREWLEMLTADAWSGAPPPDIDVPGRAHLCEVGQGGRPHLVVGRD